MSETERVSLHAELGDVMSMPAATHPRVHATGRRELG